MEKDLVPQTGNNWAVFHVNRKRKDIKVSSLIKLEPSDWPKFQEQLHYAKINQAALQTKPKETITNSPIAALPNHQIKQTQLNQKNKDLLSVH